MCAWSVHSSVQFVLCAYPPPPLYALLAQLPVAAPPPAYVVYTLLLLCAKTVKRTPSHPSICFCTVAFLLFWVAAGKTRLFKSETTIFCSNDNDSIRVSVRSDASTHSLRSLPLVHTQPSASTTQPAPTAQPAPTTTSRWRPRAGDRAPPRLHPHPAPARRHPRLEHEL